MFRRSYAVVLCLGLLVCAWSIGAASQSCQGSMVCSAYNGLYVDCLPRLAATAFNCTTFVSGTGSCTVKNASCAPAPKRKCPTCGGSPIDLATGNTFITQVDVKNPGLGGGLTLARTWNSISPQANGGAGLGLFGAGWSSTFEESVFVGSDGYMKYAQGDGDVWSLGFSGRDNNSNPLFPLPEGRVETRH